MDLRGYLLLFPEASNGYIRGNTDSKSYMDLRSYFPLCSKKKRLPKPLRKLALESSSGPLWLHLGALGE